MTTATADPVARLWTPKPLTIADLDPFKLSNGGRFLDGYPSNRRTFYSPYDDLHGVLKAILSSATHSIVVNCYGYDDDELDELIRAAAAEPSIMVQMSLDRSQAGGVHERVILAKWQGHEGSTSIAIGTSSKHAISHLKVLIVDGAWIVTGSTNWSLSGEQAQDNELTVTYDAFVAAEARSILDRNQCSPRWQPERRRDRVPNPQHSQARGRAHADRPRDRLPRRRRRGRARGERSGPVPSGRHWHSSGRLRSPRAVRDPDPALGRVAVDVRAVGRPGRRRPDRRDDQPQRPSGAALARVDVRRRDGQRDPDEPWRGIVGAFFYAGLITVFSMGKLLVPRGSPPPVRFRAKLKEGVPPPADPALGPCLNFGGRLNRDGYGCFDLVTAKHRWILAHRFAWEDANGPIPPGLEIDHRCNVRSCVRLSHLRLVTRLFNTLRSTAVEAMVRARRAIAHCPKGHAYDEENTGHRAPNRARYCKRCNRERATANYERKRARPQQLGR